MMGISKSTEMEEVVQAEETAGLEAVRQGTTIVPIDSCLSGSSWLTLRNSTVKNMPRTEAVSRGKCPT